MSSMYSRNMPPPGFYCYAYLRGDFTPYYIGKGQNKRAWIHFKKEIQPPKDISKIIILECNLTEIGAFALERRYIEWYGRKDINTGILRNRTSGGEGPVGAKRNFTTEHKNNISKSKKGKIPPCVYSRRKYSGSDNPKSRKCIDPVGKIHSSALEASIFYDECPKRIQYRCRKSTMGWKYI